MTKTAIITKVVKALESTNILLKITLKDHLRVQEISVYKNTSKWMINIDQSIQDMPNLYLCRIPVKLNHKNLYLN